MKDLLHEVLKMEAKVRNSNAYLSYYKGEITWTECTNIVGRNNAIVKALKEEADVKPKLRAELEDQLYPIDYWLRNNKPLPQSK